MRDKERLTPQRSKRKSDDVDDSESEESQPKRHDSMGIHNLTSKTETLEIQSTSKLKRKRSSDEQDASENNKRDNNDTSKLKAVKSDHRSRLPIPCSTKSGTSSSESEELSNASRTEVTKDHRKHSPSKHTDTLRIPDIEVVSASPCSVPKESIRTPVEGETLAVNFDSASPKGQKKQRTPEKDAAALGSAEKKSSSTDKRRKKERKKSQRRSSFVIGRISRKAPALSSSELSENISLDLPDDERLAKLTEEALEYTFDKLHAEFGEEVDGFQQLATKSRCAVQENVSSMKQLCVEATTKLRIVPNPVNERRRSDVQQLRADKKQLQDEIEEWDSILQHHCEQAQQARQQYEDLPNHPICKDNCSLNSRQKTILNGRLDLDKMLKELEEMKETTVLALDSISQRVRVLSTFGEIAKAEAEKQAQILSSKSFPQQSSVDPRTLIENCLHFK